MNNFIILSRKKHKSLPKMCKVWVRFLDELLKKESYFFVTSCWVCCLQVSIASGAYHVEPCDYFLQTKGQFYSWHVCKMCEFSLFYWSYFWIFVIDKKVSGAVFSLVGELKPVRMSDLFRLKCGVQVFDKDYSFGAFGFLHNRNKCFQTV